MRGKEGFVSSYPRVIQRLYISALFVCEMVLEFNSDGSIKMPKKGSKKLIVSEKVVRQEAVAVVKQDEDEVHPQVEIKCPKCGNKKAYFWTMQTRASDESETKFYKCVKCKHTWRVYR
jgi:transcription factor S